MDPASYERYDVIGAIAASVDADGAQVAREAERFGAHLGIRTVLAYGGTSSGDQKRALVEGVDLVVGTPGRLLDFVTSAWLSLRRLRALVLDEADRMLDLGFIHDIRRVLSLLPGDRQNLLFSATFSKEIRELANGLLNDPVAIDVAPRNTAAETVSQVVHPVDKRRKRELLSHMIGSHNWRQVLVFTRTKHGANRLAKQLEADGLTAAAIHGNKSQGARTRALAGFKKGTIRVLVATDIAARGLDIDQLPHVVNFELPNVPEDYVHRIGRTGRAGRGGQAVSLVCVEEHKLLRDIEKLLGRRIHNEVLDGYAPDSTIKAEPAGKQGGGRGDKQTGQRHPQGRSADATGRRRSGHSQRAGKSSERSRKVALSDRGPKPSGTKRRPGPKRGKPALLGG